MLQADVSFGLHCVCFLGLHRIYSRICLVEGWIVLQADVSFALHWVCFHGLCRMHSRICLVEGWIVLQADVSFGLHCVGFHGLCRMYSRICLVCFISSSCHTQIFSHHVCADKYDVHMFAFVTNVCMHVYKYLWDTGCKCVLVCFLLLCVVCKHFVCWVCAFLSV